MGRVDERRRARAGGGADHRQVLDCHARRAGDVGDRAPRPAGRSVRQPCPRIRTERAPSRLSGALIRYVPASRHTVPPRVRTASIACWIVAVPALWASACTHTVQSQLSLLPAGGQWMRQSSVAGQRDDRQPREVMVDAARRRVVEEVDGAVGGTGGDRRAVAGADCRRGRGGADRTPISSGGRVGAGTSMPVEPAAFRLWNIVRIAAGAGSTGPSGGPAVAVASVRSGPSTGKRSAGRASSNWIDAWRLDAVARRIRRSGRGGACNSCPSSAISTQSPVLKERTSSRPSVANSSSPAETMLATRAQTLAFSRDHLKVAVAPGWPGSWISTR